MESDWDAGAAFAKKQLAAHTVTSAGLPETRDTGGVSRGQEGVIAGDNYRGTDRRRAIFCLRLTFCLVRKVDPLWAQLFLQAEIALQLTSASAEVLGPLRGRLRMMRRAANRLADNPCQLGWSFHVWWSCMMLLMKTELYSLSRSEEGKQMMSESKRPQLKIFATY